MALRLREIEGKATPHLTQWPPSKLSHGQEVGCFSCCFCIHLCVFFLSLPILSPKYHQTRLGPEVSIRLWRGDLMAHFVWPQQEHPPDAPSQTAPGLLNPFSCRHKGTSASHFSFVQILVCLREVKRLHLIVTGID